MTKRRSALGVRSWGDTAKLCVLVAAMLGTLGLGLTFVGVAPATANSTPTVAFVFPSSGPSAGGTTVTITGTGFNASCIVMFGDSPATAVVLISPTEIVATAPAGPAGTFDVTVNCPPFGASPVSPADQFTYTGLPSVTSVSPNQGPISGGTPVTITGTGWGAAVLSVQFGSTAASGSFTIDSPSSITVMAPPHTAGTVDVTVTTASGTSPTGPNDEYTYIAPPTITSLSPTDGSVACGTLVTITGTGFNGATAADFGSTNPATSFTVVSSTEITATAPVGLRGTVDVTVTTPGGTSALAPSDQFTFLSSGPIAVTPNSGPITGGTSVVITGSCLAGATAVDFGTTAATSFTVDSGTSISATSPAGSGTVEVTVNTPAGTSAISASDQFTYNPPPPVTSSGTASSHGYWLIGSDGGIFSFGSAQFYGSTGSLKLQRPVVGIVPTKDDAGYWLDASDGGVFSFGDTQFYGSIPGLGLNPAGSGLPNSLNAPIVGMVPSNDDGGYFMVARDGGVFAFGDARFAGSCPGIGGCSGAAVAVMPDASGNGYWLVTQTGTVYTFGDASYDGAPGNTGSPVTSAVSTPNGGGYWILTANGTVYNYGNAANLGDAAGAFGGFDPATAVFTTSDGGGYWIASANGTVDNYGDAPNDGGMAGTPLNGSIIAATGF